MNTPISAARVTPQAALVALLLSLGFALLMVIAAGVPEPTLRELWWDHIQSEQPRARHNDSVVVVSIDDDSLTQLGPWPWPRTRLAQLIGSIHSAKPAILGVDIILPERDRYHPSEIQRATQMALAALADGGEVLDGDAQLAQAIAMGPTVMAAIAQPDTPGPAAPGTPDVVVPKAVPLPVAASLLRSLPVLTAAATSEGAINAGDAGGTIRRVPTVLRVGGKPILGLATEIVRQIEGGPPVRWQSTRSGTQLRVGNAGIPVAGDGGWRLRYSRFTQRPHLRAVDVMSDAKLRSALEGRVVLLGYTAAGLVDVVRTPLGETPGVDVHAEALDNYLDQQLLQRPAWARWAEAATLLAASALVMLMLWLQGPLLASAAAITLIATLFALSQTLLTQQGWLTDPIAPSFALLLVLGVELGLSLQRSRQQRQALADALQASREHAAFLAGELDAARRIQLGMLPKQEQVLQGDRRARIVGHMDAARTVGGDFFDFYRDDARLWFAVGDVSGKGLPASLFMSLVKTRLHSAALRAGGCPAAALCLANQELAQENPEAQFVTVLMGVLDLASGQLQLSSAGHDAPLRFNAERAPAVLTSEGGPPLGMLDDFPYLASRYQLAPGDNLLLFTDGATDQRPLQGTQLGVRGLHAMADQLWQAHRDAAPEAWMTHWVAALAAHRQQRELEDDLTLLALRYQGDAA